MNKIMRVFYLLTNNMPSKYIIPVKLYRNTESLLRERCKDGWECFEEIVAHYDHYFATHRYINTKYYCRNPKKPGSAFDIVALATYPISLSKDKLMKKSHRKIAYIILHEWGHFAKGDDEIKADKFAIEHIRRLIKEGVF